jgi:hypothetical protein
VISRTRAIARILDSSGHCNKKVGSAPVSQLLFDTLLTGDGWLVGWLVVGWL